MSAVTFVIGFVVVLGAFISLIVVASSRLGPVVSPRLYSRVETTIVAGILLGTAVMIQPWISAGLQWGFLLLLFSTLAFIVWSHVTPKRAPSGGDPHNSAMPESAPAELGE